MKYDILPRYIHVYNRQNDDIDPGIRSQPFFSQTKTLQKKHTTPEKKQKTGPISPMVLHVFFGGVPSFTLTLLLARVEVERQQQHLPGPGPPKKNTPRKGSWESMMDHL